MTPLLKTIRGKRWLFQFVPNLFGQLGEWGSCDSPGTPGKSIRVDAGLRGQKLLETLVHEQLHAAYWDLDEEAIHEAARDIAKNLIAIFPDLENLTIKRGDNE